MALVFYFFFFLMIRRPPRSTLFPYTRSSDLVILEAVKRPRVVGETLLEKMQLLALRHRIAVGDGVELRALDRKSTRLNSSHGYISYAVFCLKKKKKRRRHRPHLIITTT